MTTDQAAHHKAEDEKRKLETQISALKEKLEANGIGSICWFRSSSLLSDYHHTRAGWSYQRNLIIKTSPSIDSSWWQLLLHNPRSTCSSLASLSPPSTPLCMRPESAATERWWSSSWLLWSSSWRWDHQHDCCNHRGVHVGIIIIWRSTASSVSSVRTIIHSLNKIVNHKGEVKDLSFGLFSEFVLPIYILSFMFSRWTLPIWKRSSRARKSLTCPRTWSQAFNFSMGFFTRRWSLTIIMD